MTQSPPPGPSPDPKPDQPAAPDQTAQPTPDQMPEPKPDQTAQPTPDQAPDATPDPNPDPNPDANPDANPETGPAAKPDLKLDAHRNPGRLARQGVAPPGFVRRPPPPRLKPRPVTGGIRLSADTVGWAGQRWLRAVEATAPSDQVAEGLEYARSGQTRSIDIETGLVRGRVQGRQSQAYRVEIRIPSFNHAQWDAVMKPMLSQARYVATLLAGDLPANIEDVFAPIGLRLFPSEPQDVATSCSCSIEGQWCKHAACVMRLMADRLDREPFLIFELRGLDREELLEQVRNHRTLGGVSPTDGSVPAYRPHLPGVADRSQKPLEDVADRFWEVGPGLNDIDLPLEPPEVSHPLLRRLGPSPFDGAKFPLVGLLATCFDVISEAAIEGAEGEDRSDDPTPVDD